ncbi:Fibronectin type III domain protein [Caldicellulosiruptor kronotskyensis 2002]|uniref:Fibronectin type III domain protein n=1 Tax=Caldicellulosiruptor kronotskyensis (strain DSM 18902 / VKM B-2412 / 2002) TaxID=632348 RepID=E4SCT6_CALK2|nr:fibronectin type III domain-containing protein [Caldicellulosiruptor kronotskyensis]ADQ45069.1 Fibronectin type III domain protein [Caldicellulosiruptor kronotskyensis 2002]
MKKKKLISLVIMLVFLVNSVIGVSTVFMVNAFAGTWPVTWNYTVIGDSTYQPGSPVGSFDHQTGKITVSATQAEINRTSTQTATTVDYFPFVYTQVNNTIFTAYVYINDPILFTNANSNYPRGGLIVRNGLGIQDSYYAALVEYNSASSTKWDLRAQRRFGSTAGSSTRSAISFPCVLKIVRSSSTNIAAYYGEVNTNTGVITWYGPIGARSDAGVLNSTLYVGVGIAVQGSNGNPATLQTSFVRIKDGVADSNTSPQNLSDIFNLPQKPQLIVESGDSQAKLMWSYDRNAISYDILLSEDGSNFNLVASNVTETSEGLLVVQGNAFYTINGLTNGKQYFVKVRAKNEYGVTESDPVIVVPEKPTPPAKPTVIQTAYSDGWVSIKWKTVSKATYYVVYIGDAPNNYTDWKIVNDNGLPNQTYECKFDNLINKKPYYLRLFAGNNVGLSEGSDEVVIVPYPIPAIPTFEVIPGVLELTVKWNKVEDAERYTLYLGKSSKNYTISAIVYDDGSPFYTYTFKKLEGLQYYITMNAANNSGTSANAQEVSAMPLLPQHYVTNLVVYDQDNAANWSLRYNLQVGSKIFGDRDYAVVSMPTVLEGAYWISTANLSRSYNATPVIASFIVTEDVDIYVAIDSRLYTSNQVPVFLSTWDLTDYKIIDNGTNPQVTYLLYKKSFSKGSLVELGYQGVSSGCVFYFVLMKKQLFSIDSEDIVYTNKPVYNIKGKIFAGASVTIKKANEIVATYDTADQDREFNISISLQEGENLIEFSAISTDGYISNRLIKIVYDSTSPKITFKQTPVEYENETPSAIIKFVCDEDIYINIKVNEQTVLDNVYCPALQDKELLVPLSEGNNTISLTAKDKSGNIAAYQWVTVYEYMIKNISFVDDYENQITSLTANAVINVLARAENKLNISKDIAIVIAYYNSANQMIGYSISYDTVLPNSSEELLAGIQMPSYINGLKVKAFIWNSLEGMIPLSSVIDLK